MVESKFFTLSDDSSDESREFASFVSGITATGGGDAPENALEALAIAMNSDWVRTGSVRRHVIHLYTDAPALALGARKESANYPADMPADLAELREWWEGQTMEKRAKRLQIFAPDAEPWPEFLTWTNTVVTPSKAGAGCPEADTDTCIHLLVQSI